MKTGIEIIKEERERQISQEGWTPEHDDQHRTGEMAAAARCYALMSEAQNIGHGWNRDMVEDQIFGQGEWPWDDGWWKPSDQLRNLAKAGALIAAEIDRLQRKSWKKEKDDMEARDRWENENTIWQRENRA